MCCELVTGTEKYICMMQLPHTSKVSVSGPSKNNLLNAQPPAIRALYPTNSPNPTSHVHINNKPMATYQICVTTDHFFWLPSTQPVYAHECCPAAGCSSLDFSFKSCLNEGLYTFVVGLPVAKAAGEPKKLRLGCATVCVYSKAICVFEASNIPDGNELVLTGPRCGTVCETT